MQKRWGLSRRAAGEYPGRKPHRKKQPTQAETSPLEEETEAKRRKQDGKETETRAVDNAPNQRPIPTLAAVANATITSAKRSHTEDEHTAAALKRRRLEKTQSFTDTLVAEERPRKKMRVTGASWQARTFHVHCMRPELAHRLCLFAASWLCMPQGEESWGYASHDLLRQAGGSSNRRG